ncbi:protein of unknown function [Agreia sp. COWG]|nr:protein of unknown function [Agreia sp. COWG]
MVPVSRNLSVSKPMEYNTTVLQTRWVEIYRLITLL